MLQKYQAVIFIILATSISRLKSGNLVSFLLLLLSLSWVILGKHLHARTVYARLGAREWSIQLFIGITQIFYDLLQLNISKPIKILHSFFFFFYRDTFPQIPPALMWNQLLALKNKNTTEHLFWIWNRFYKHNKGEKNTWTSPDLAKADPLLLARLLEIVNQSLTPSKYSSFLSKKATL